MGASRRRRGHPRREGASVSLKSGDHLFLPAGTPHTVTQVSDGAIWLAVHLHLAEGSDAS